MTYDDLWRKNEQLSNEIRVHRQEDRARNVTSAARVHVNQYYQESHQAERKRHCLYWVVDGNCMKGDNCTYLHDPSDKSYFVGQVEMNRNTQNDLGYRRDSDGKETSERKLAINRIPYGKLPSMRRKAAKRQAEQKEKEVDRSIASFSSQDQKEALKELGGRSIKPIPEFNNINSKIERLVVEYRLGERKINDKVKEDISKAAIAAQDDAVNTELMDTLRLIRMDGQIKMDVLIEEMNKKLRELNTAPARK